MSGSRRTQRGVRVVIATLLVVVAGAGVAIATASGAAVAAAGIAAAVAGLVAVKIMHSEIVQTRRRSAADRSAQAKSFGQALATKQAEHMAFTAAMTSRLGAKDQTIRELVGTVRLADRRADEAEDRVKRESRRANEAQEQLAELLDGVLAAREEAGDNAEALHDLPTIVDLLAWEDKSNAAVVDELRKQA